MIHNDRVLLMDNQSIPLSDLNGDAPSCPPNTLQKFGVAYPSLVFTFGLLALSSIIFALITGLKFNSIKVFKKKVSRETISNTFWIAYYVSVAVRTACQCVVFGISSPQRHYIDNIFQLFVLIIQGISAFCLSLALNHQYRYRSKTNEVDPFIDPIITGKHEARVYAPANQRSFSGAVVPSSARGSNENQALLQPNSNSINAVDVSKIAFLRRALLSPEAVFFVLFVAYLVGLYLKVANLGTIRTGVIYLVFMAIYIIQRIPPIVLVVVIVLKGVCCQKQDAADSNNGINADNAQPEGPTIWSKIFLIIATVLHGFNDLPYDFWADVLTQLGCVFYIASWLDLVHILYFVALLFFFIFLRAEYHRNRENCLYETVAEARESSFDFKNFHSSLSSRPVSRV
eukprot:TRINITY_DN13690_c0_g1_i1.p1 TRINITY_DN13690_c0_g1~~TRINITY_DN13690_c0_g1_i1.p1  ORF type:complete len:400 (+),score=45.80 TRINITY_DN13690_c0_g1_i1:41-1240(+)